MSTTARKPITVAVSGEELAALAWAVAEARRTDSPLRLVHAIDQVPMATAPGGPVVSYAELEEAAHRILNRAAYVVRTLTDAEIPLEQVVRRGPAAWILVDESSSSRLVVLEHRALSRLARVFSASTSTAVAARAHCPVVSVPEAWEPGAEHGLVIVGLDDAAQPVPALSVAFDEADSRQASLLVLSAWQLAPPYDDIAAATGVEDEWRERIAPTIERAVEQGRVRAPEVKTTIELRYGQPADTLAEAAKEADLMVLGRRTRRGPLRIGSLARAMIRVSVCPVMVVPVAEVSEEEGWGLDPVELSPQS